MIYFTWGKLYANDTLIYRERYVTANITEDALYMFFSTRNGVSYYKVCDPSPYKIHNYEIEKEVLFSIRHIERK